jgi:ABC-type lipoprotein release transport system permease subunit
MINSYILTHFGIDDLSSVAGKTVTFLIDDTAYIKNLKVAGIINEKYFNMESTASKNDIIIYDSLENISDYCIGGEDVQFYLPIDDLLNNTDVYNAVEQLRTNRKVICSEGSLIGLSYTEKLSEVSKKILSVICVFIIFSMILSVFSIIKTNIVSSRSYYGMLSAIGMSRRSLFVSFFTEQILLIVIALVASFPVYEIFVLCINKIISAMISDEIEITLSQLLKIYTMSSVICFAVISFISCLTFFTSVSKNIVTSLK